MSTTFHPALPPLERQLVATLLRGFPLVPAPFAAVARKCNASERDVIEAVRGLIAKGIATRLGAVVRPNTIGASTLAALACPPSEVDYFGKLITGISGVTHNYAREHDWLALWFVVCGQNQAAVDATLLRIEEMCGRQVIAFPLEREYRIDLGFGFDPHSRVCPPSPAAKAMDVQPIDREILAEIEDGLPLEPRPYDHVAHSLGCTEERVRERLARLLEGGVVKRFGLVVRHRSLGFEANAMVVFAAGSQDVDDIAQRFLDVPAVTLLYARRPAPPAWPYRLYAMIHGRKRADVQAEIRELLRLAGRPLPHEVLFSTACFKQTGARFSA